MIKPKISVAMCTYNGETYVQEQLKSILGQTRSPFELIICDDSSSDDTVSLISRLVEKADFPVRIFVQERNVGVNQNFSTAMSMCSGDYIALADQDDVWDFKKLEVFSDEIERCAYISPVLLYSDLKLIDASGVPLKKRFSEAVRLDRSLREHWQRLAFGNFIPGCSMLLHRSCIQMVLPIPSEAILHDWWIALVVSLNSQLIYIDRELMSYRIHANNNQGMHSHRRTISRIVRYGLLKLGTNNFLIALRQFQAAGNRLTEMKISLPGGMEEVCRIRDSARLLRPIMLYKQNVRRVSALLGSLLIGRTQCCDDSVGHL